MWIAKFKLKDDEDIYSPICVKYNIDFYAVPYTIFIKGNKIHALAGGVISGNEENKKKFIHELKKDKRVRSVGVHYDFVFVHTTHKLSRESRAEIKIFYNPQYIRVKPVHVSIDGWEYWEIACLDRNELNKLIDAAEKYYHGVLFFIKEEKLKAITSLTITPNLTEKQLEAIKLAYKEGYYNYPRTLTIHDLSKKLKRSYSTFQEHLRRSENKLIDYFLKYR